MTLSSLYSAFIVDPRIDPPPVWRLFSYGIAQDVPGSTNTSATRAHTNVPRAGYSGLPRDWDATIDQWRALTSIRFAEPVLEWASQVEATFRYNDKIVDARPLLDLLFSAHHVYEQTAVRFGDVTGQRQSLQPLRSPLWVRENLSYEVELSVHTHVTQKLQRWLVEHTSDYRLITWIYLEGIVRSAWQ